MAGPPWAITTGLPFGGNSPPPGFGDDHRTEQAKERLSGTHGNAESELPSCTSWQRAGTNGRTEDTHAGQYRSCNARNRFEISLRGHLGKWSILDAEAVAWHVKLRFPNLPIILRSAYSGMPERILGWWMITCWKSELPEPLPPIMERTHRRPPRVLTTDAKRGSSIKAVLLGRFWPLCALSLMAFPRACSCDPRAARVPCPEVT